MAKKQFLLIAALALSATANLAQNVSRECYRGFFDGGYTIGAGDYTFNRFEVNTSHGYQITPSFFVGGGAGMHFMSSYETSSMVIPLDVRKSKVDIPLFVNARFNMSEGHYVPFLDVKAGKYITYEGGLYMKYSYSGNNVTKVSYSLDDKELFGTFFWEYDEQGNMLRETWTNGETGKSTVQFEGVYEYNTDGQLIKSTTHGMFERELTYKEYSYDEEGRITTVRLSNSYSTRKSELRYSYIWE